MSRPVENDPLLDLNGKDRAKILPNCMSMLAQNGWQFGCVCFFVVLGAGQALTTRIAVSNHDGHLPYDTAAAVLVAETMKLVFAIVWVFACDWNSLTWDTPKAWRYESMDLLVVACLFALQNQLSFLIIERLGAGLFMILGNLKIVFTCVFMRVLLDKKFVTCQWLAVALLTGSAVLVKFQVLFGIGSDESTSQGSLVFGFFLLLVSAMSSGLASVKNELILKRGAGTSEAMPFMAKNAVLYFWGFWINIVSWGFWGKQPVLAVFAGPWRIASVAMMAGMGLACAVILRYLDNVVRCFSSVAQVLLTVAMSHMLPAWLHEGSFDLYYIASLVFLGVSLVLYQAHDSPRLKLYCFTAATCGLLVGVFCYAVDSYHQRTA
eukprot:CAMPEP_0117485842 /NCGR_PEP_ID=MMETSP0784-20121206/15171_1 /TAXON_ID=39447 /ORGANISM="" /LENGTH=377 /DNA_ID=CAMNT_0005280437 /DNA_START=26 /DNA_END=1159 /DNA_ORIENTATION=-